MRAKVGKDGVLRKKLLPKMTAAVKKQVVKALKGLAEDVHYLQNDFDEVADEFNGLDPRYIKQLTIDDIAMFEQAVENAEGTVSSLTRRLAKFNKDFRKYFPEDDN